MFKGMHPVFWIGLAIMYGFAIIFWVWETALPGSVFTVKMGGMAAPFLYSGIFMLAIINVFLAWLWCYVPEKIEEKEQMNLGNGGEKGVSS
ncbi:MAG: hypothetical protein ACOY30_02425 [Bacillota bacterium]